MGSRALSWPVLDPYHDRFWSLIMAGSGPDPLRSSVSCCLFGVVDRCCLSGVVYSVLLTGVVYSVLLTGVVYSVLSTGVADRCCLFGVVYRCDVDCSFSRTVYSLPGAQ